MHQLIRHMFNASQSKCFSGLILENYLNTQKKIVQTIGKDSLRPKFVSCAESNENCLKTVSSIMEFKKNGLHEIPNLNFFKQQTIFERNFYILPSLTITKANPYLLPTVSASIQEKHEPLGIINDKLDPLNILPVYDPRPQIEKKAERLIVIRRRKMRVHKLKKLRKRMYFVFLKARMRREAKKEKAFQSEILMQISQAEAFDAEEWVKDVLRKSNYYAAKKAQNEFYETPEGIEIKKKLIWQRRLTEPTEWRNFLEKIEIKKP